MTAREIEILNNNLSEHQLIWHGVCVYLYSDLILKEENR